MTTIYWRELQSYFKSGNGTLFMAVYLFIFGLYFTFMNIFPNPSSAYSTTIKNMIFIFILLFPAITMKSYAEEKKNKTEQLLFTSPISITRIILGKYLAAITLLITTLALTFIHAIILSYFTLQIDWYSILTAYIGFLLMGCSFIAIGQFISVISENQIVAGLGTLGVSIILYIISSVAPIIPRDSLSGLFFIIVSIVIISVGLYWFMKNIGIATLFLVGTGGLVGWQFWSNSTFFEGLIQRTIKVFSITKYSEEYFINVISLSSVVYYISIIVLFLFLSYCMIERRRWS